MPITEKKFKEYLMLYGTSIENWPEAMRKDAMQAQGSMALNRLMIEQQFFDEVLFNNRHFEPPNPAFADRIIHAARTVTRSPGASIATLLRELLVSVLPQPAFVLATVLTLGIAIGLAVPVSPAGENDALMQSWFESNGGIL